MIASTPRVLFSRGPMFEQSFLRPRGFYWAHEWGVDGKSNAINFFANKYAPKAISAETNFRRCIGSGCTRTGKSAVVSRDEYAPSWLYNVLIITWDLLHVDHWTHGTIADERTTLEDWIRWYCLHCWWDTAKRSHIVLPARVNPSRIDDMCIIVLKQLCARLLCWCTRRSYGMSFVPIVLFSLDLLWRRSERTS